MPSISKSRCASPACRRDLGLGASVPSSDSVPYQTRSGEHQTQERCVPEEGMMMDYIQRIGGMVAQHGTDFQIFNELDYLVQKRQCKPDCNGCLCDGTTAPPQHRPGNRQSSVCANLYHHVPRHGCSSTSIRLIC